MKRDFLLTAAIAASVSANAALPASATTVTSVLEAKGDYMLGVNPAVSLLQSLPSDPVDVIAFPGSSPNSAVLHSYGSSSGTFGSRSSGIGIYDVTGGFRIDQTITNVSAAPQNAIFTFTITPGFLQNSIPKPITGAEYVTSGIAFDIKRDGLTVYDSSAVLTSNSGGTTFNTLGDASLYSGSGTYYSILAKTQTIDLGPVAPGASFLFSYTLDTFAEGISVPGSVVAVPGSTFFVPEQCFVEPGILAEICIPAHTVNALGYVNPNPINGSHASSGDPFDFDSFGNAIVPLGLPFAPRPGAVELVPVPTPPAVALFGLGALALAGWTGARRRAA